MGIMSGDAGNTLYLNVSGGQLINKKKEIAAFAYEGILTHIEQKDDVYENQPISKIRLTMKDAKTGEKAVITFTEDSYYSLGFFSRINKIDLDKPFVLGVNKSDKNEKISFCWMKQLGNKIEKDPEFPQQAKVSVGKGKEVTNWEPVVDAIRVLIEQINAKTFRGKDTSTEDKTNSSNTGTANADDDDLPF